MNAIERLNAITEEQIELKEEQIFKTIFEDGRVEFKNSKGELNNVNDEPAVIQSNGTKVWYKNGKLHRDNNLPAIVEADGTQYWYINGERVK